ncbi:hypothetical protein [Ascidiimonas aurantiaca]|uniref:hypothetical protein n=1 Tax=Ascidiimonas aurantiaca TaxID=1685432 RepID=UPI0030ED3024
MEELDILKKDWKRKEETLPKLSYDDIYRMIWKKSSSIVRWIFYISIIEIILGILLTFFIADKDYWDDLEKYDMVGITIFTYSITYIIAIYFVVLFYRNYKLISAADSTSKLMENIFRTRKTVKRYIAIALTISGIYSIYFFISIMQKEVIAQTLVENDGVLPDYFWLMMIIIGIITVFITIGIMWLIYQLFYGLLLRGLRKNYKELQSIE